MPEQAAKTGPSVQKIRPRVRLATPEPGPVLSVGMVAQPSMLGLNPEPPSSPGTVVDLFCGAGGLSHGFALEGFDVQAGFDVDPACRHAFEANNDAAFHERDVGSLKEADLAALFAKDEPTILVGCAPCRPFSTNNQRRPDHPEWRLIESFGSLIRETTPDIVSMENVPRLRSFNGGKLLAGFRSLLEDELGYSVWCQSVNCASYGVPQTRRRLVLLASRTGPIKLVPPTHEPSGFRTVRETIAHLPALGAGGQSPDDPLHCASRMSPTNLARIRASKAGGTWRDWDDDLVAPCHRRSSGRLYENVYGRMSWDAPAPTITTKCTGFGNGRFGHPEQDRALSLREAALLQSFPEDYEFFPPEEPTRPQVGARMIGNAVPVALGRAIASSVAKTLATGESDG